MKKLKTTKEKQFSLFGTETVEVKHTRELRQHIVINPDTLELIPTYRVWCDCGKCLGTFESLLDARQAMAKKCEDCK